MSTRNEHQTEALGAYALNALDEQETREVSEHLAQCAECRIQLDELVSTRDALGDIPPEMFLDGPPDGGDLLLQRTLRAVRGNKRAGRLNRQLVTTAAAVAAVAIALGGGVLVGANSSDTGSQNTALPPQTSAPPTAGTVVPGTKVVSATLAGARITATVTPAVGWVRVNASVVGIPAGQRCQIVLVSRTGEREVVGSWQVSATSAATGSNLDGSAAIPMDQVASIMVQNFAGHTFVAASM